MFKPHCTAWPASVHLLTKVVENIFGLDEVGTMI